MNSTTKVVLGVIGAAAAGAVIGMLLAPEKGKDMRKKVKDTANDLACQLADLFAESKNEFNNIKNKAAKSAKEFAGQAEERVKNATEKLS